MILETVKTKEGQLHEIASVTESLLNVTPTNLATPAMRERLDALRSRLNRLKKEYAWTPDGFYHGLCIRLDEGTASNA